MKRTCEKISQDKLVAFADGELPPAEAAKVADHVRRCESCTAMVEALQESLKLLRLSWTAEQAQWPKWRARHRPRLRTWPAVRVLTVAAGILLLLGLGLMWRMVSKPGEPVRPQEGIAQLERTVMRAGTAARMLAIADLLANQPEGREYARNRYMEIVEEFAGTDCAEQARLRLKSL